MKLDYEQDIAAKCLNNNSIIIAGAGCGKTTTLIKKIDNLIKSGIKENDILVLSYTNETVNNFKQKCHYNIKVLTFHKAALEFQDHEYDIADDFIIDKVILDFLTNLNMKLKKKIFHMWYRYKIYNDKNYYSFINETNSTSIFKVIKNACKIIKTNNININNLECKTFGKNEIFMLYVINKIIGNYNNELYKNNFIDFDDMIVLATKNITSGVVKHNYKHILVDEYQDISQIRQNFLKALVKSNNSIITVVGDDWQSIYQFSGSNLNIFLNYKNEFNNVKVFYITNTYRCPQKIINMSSKFILKNKLQINKKLNSVNKHKGKFKKIYTNNFKNVLYNILKSISNDKSVLVLSRNSFDIQKYISKKLRIDSDTLFLDNKKMSNIKYMTIHKSKGLEADVVIIINLSSGYNGFPSNKNTRFIEKIIGYHEPIKYAEERRLFYVALTRTKSDLYLIINKKNSSIFTNET